MNIIITITAYNKEKTIQYVLEALIQQDYEDRFEIYVIDDYSFDRSREIIREYVSNSFINIIFNDINKGLAKNINDSIKQSNGK